MYIGSSENCGYNFVISLVNRRDEESYQRIFVFFLPPPKGLVSKSARFSSVLIYVTRHSSAANI